MKQFQISTRYSGRKRIIKVYIYDSAKELRIAGVDHNIKIGSHITERFEGAWGLTQSFESMNVYKRGAIRRRPLAGYIRLVKSALKTGVISHEATHMAIAIYQQDIARTIPDIEREEKLCYLVGDITRQIVNKLYRLNLIPEAK